MSDEQGQVAYYALTEQQLLSLAEESASSAVTHSHQDLVALLAASEEASPQGSVVIVDASQWGELRQMIATDIQGGVFCVGFLALILGAVVGVAMTLHWRAGGNG